MNSFVIVKKRDNAYVGLIKEYSIGLHWYRGPKEEGKVIVNESNAFDLIEMREVGAESGYESNYYEEVEGVVCRIGLSGLRACVDVDSLTDGMYLCRAGSKEWKKISSFTIDFWRKRNGRLLCNIIEEVR